MYILILFKRISFIKRSDAELEKFLEFELTPYPLGLFDEKGVRKTQKLSFYPNFRSTDKKPMKKDSNMWLMANLFFEM